LRSFMAKPEEIDICGRIAKVREEVAGPRGKSLFAKQLGLSASTYSYYEFSRVPPAEVLVHIADLGAVDLRWLLTGQTAADAPVPADHPILQRAAKLLADRPNAAGPLAAFLDIFSQALAFPRRKESQNGQAAAAPAAQRASQSPQAAWIPVLGRTAAGLAQFWSDKDDSSGLTSLNDLIARHARPVGRQVQPAVASGERIESAGVQLVTVTDPREEVCEFIAAPALKAKYPDAFALRVDGDSMAPDIVHGDMVVLSLSRQAEDGRSAVVQLRGQIGVTCKIYRRQGAAVHLIPINEKYAPAAHPAAQVLWALRVLARVRA